jgi:hypothetical protein
MIRRTLAVALALGLLPLAAHAANLTSFGPRFGVSISPDQLVLGGQVIVTDVAPNISLVPNLELGFGDDRTVIAINADMHYHVAVQGTDWTPYLGLGIGINSIQHDLPAPFRDESDTEVGLNIILGTDVPTGAGNKFFGEARVGAGGGVPELKIIAGWNFGLR